MTSALVSQTNVYAQQGGAGCVPTPLPKRTPFLRVVLRRNRSVRGRDRDLNTGAMLHDRAQPVVRASCFGQSAVAARQKGAAGHIQQLPTPAPLYRGPTHLPGVTSG